MRTRRDLVTYARTPTVGHPEHMSTFGVVNPAHLTPTVTNLARQAMEHHRRAITAGYDAIEARNAIYPILADALQDAGATDEKFLTALRNPQLVHSTNREAVVDLLTGDVPSWVQSLAQRWDRHVKGYAAGEALRKAHAAVVGPDSDLPVGFVVRRHGGGPSGMRGNPPPGEIWHRPAYRSGGFWHGAQHKQGRALTLQELKALAAQKSAERGQARRQKTAANLTLRNVQPPPDIPDRLSRRRDLVTRYSATEGDVNNLLHQIATNPEHRAAGSHVRLVAADALQEQGRDREADVLRSHRHPVQVRDGRVYREYPLHQTLRDIAMGWHGGGNSHLYGIGSTGRVNGESARGALEEMDDVRNYGAAQTGLDHPDESEPFNRLYDYLSSVERETADEQGDEPERMSRRPNPVKGGVGDDTKVKDVDPTALAQGEKVELEHTSDPAVARDIAIDHLAELGDRYYENLARMEEKLKATKKTKSSRRSVVAYAAGSFSAPPGGMVARGTYYLGGQRIPSMGGEFMKSGRRRRKRPPRAPKPVPPPVG